MTLVFIHAGGASGMPGIKRVGNWVFLLGLASGISLAHAEELLPAIGTEPSMVTAAEEENGPEHGKINTPDASPVDPGHFEIESFYAYTRSTRYWDNSGGSHTRGLAREQAVGLAITIGVVDNVDVAIGGSYLWVKDNENDFDEGDAVFGPHSGHDWGDVDVSVRYRFFTSTDHSLELAYIGGFTLPAGSSSSEDEIGTSQEFWSFNQTLVAGKDWGKWTANADLGYALPFGDEREHARGSFNADIAVGYQLLSWLQPEVELNYCLDFYAVEEDQQVLAATVGLVMPINDRLRVNAGVQQGLWGQNTDKATSLFAAVKLAF